MLCVRCGLYANGGLVEVEQLELCVCLCILERSDWKPCRQEYIQKIYDRKEVSFQATEKNLRLLCIEASKSGAFHLPGVAEALDSQSLSQQLSVRS